MNNIQEALLGRINEKFQAIGQNPNVHLEGLVWAKPITYWDYIHTDALLSLQIPRTTLPDEMVFIMYHQINELLFKMILWEIQQVATPGSPDAAFFAEKLDRISNYFDVLSSSFSVMQNGMQREQYNKFRNTLTPASGFQSAQYRLIEFASTNWMNLIDNRFRAGFDAHADLEKVYEHLYWQAAGRDHATGQRTTLIQLFEERYKSEFLRTLNQYRDCNLWATYLQLPEEARNNTQLKKAMRHYDFTVNVTWVMAHFHAAERYLDDGSGKTAEGTGGSNWKKYMHPRYQRRIFFPGLWTEAELADWGNTETEPELQ